MLGVRPEFSFSYRRQTYRKALQATCVFTLIGLGVGRPESSDS